MNIKALMILGSVVGFLIGIGFGIASNRPGPDALWRACAAALVAALLTRWWGGVWVSGLSDALRQQREAQEAKRAEAKLGVKG